MTLYTRLLVYPEGDIQEIDHALRVNQHVDLNGNPLAFPLRTTRLIAYRVCRITTRLERGEEITNYHLELVSRPELEGLQRG